MVLIILQISKFSDYLAVATLTKIDNIKTFMTWLQHLSTERKRFEI